jgi:hypothetical protein
MLANLWVSAGTFRYSFSEKVAFVALNLADLLLTVFAISLGLNELNPWVRELLGNPLHLVIAKCAVPAALAWLIPGKLLLPAILLLSFVVGWDIKELVIFLA